MNVLLTIGILLALGGWLAVSYARLLRLRQRVTAEWREAHAPRGAESLERTAARERYSRVAREYNAALTAFPGNLIALLTGFKRAEALKSNP